MYIGNKLASSGSTPTSIDTLGPLLEAEDYCLSYTSGQRNSLFRLGHMLLSVWKFRNYDLALIDTYSTWAFYYAWATSCIASLLGLKYIPILHGGNMPERFARSPKMCRQIFSNSLVNVAVSPYLEQHLLSNNYKAVLVPNSINLALYPFRERSAIKPRLLWVRAFHSIYHPQLAVQLLKRLTEKYPEACLTMVGPEKDGSLVECKKLAAQLGIEEKVVFTGKLSKAEWILLSEQHDIFINTTRFDNLPVSLIEAMALGLPIVSTNVGGIPFLINDHRNGLLADSGDLETIYSAVEQLMLQPELAKTIAGNAREDAERFDWNQVKYQWREILK